MSRKFTALAQLIELLAEKGITSTPALVERTGYTDRAIRKAKVELECRNQGAGSGTIVPEPEFRSGTRVPETEPGCRNQGSALARAYIESPSEIDSYQEVKKKTPLPPKGASPSECLTAFEAWNDLALRTGLPQAAKLTPDRQRKIAARLKAYGLDGWATALANIEKSAFLTGQNDRCWRANLEFVLQPTSFAKLHDGAYGNGRHAEKPKRTAWQVLQEMEAASDVQ